MSSPASAVRLSDGGDCKDAQSCQMVDTMVVITLSDGKTESSQYCLLAMARNALPSISAAFSRVRILRSRLEGDERRPSD